MKLVGKIVFGLFLIFALTSKTTEAIFGLDFEMDNFFRFLALMLRGPFGGSSGGMSFGFPGMMGSQPGFMGGPSGFMGNQPGFMGGPSGFMGNQPGFMGGPSGFMGNQPGLKGGPSGFMGNQPYLGSNTGFSGIRSNPLTAPSRR